MRRFECPSESIISRRSGSGPGRTATPTSGILTLNRQLAGVLSTLSRRPGCLTNHHKDCRPSNTYRSAMRQQKLSTTAARDRARFPTTTQYATSWRGREVSYTRRRLRLQRLTTRFGFCADGICVAVDRGGRGEDGGLHEDGNTTVKRCGRTAGMRKEGKKDRRDRLNGTRINDKFESSNKIAEEQQFTVQRRLGEEDFSGRKSSERKKRHGGILPHVAHRLVISKQMHKTVL